MSQHDYVLDNAAGAAFRADLNAALMAIVSMNSGATAPATPYAYMPWWDTATGKFKIRNAANTAWLLVSSLGDAEAATLTNKSISLASNTLSGTLAQFNAACSDADFASLAGVETLTNKTINLSSNTLSGTIAQFNAACSDADFVGTASPAFTGTPTAPTAAAGTNTTQLATTAFVQGQFVRGTEVASTSGTAIDFTGIPSWAKRITVMFNGVSTNGTSHMLVQIGAGSVDTASYLSTSAAVNANTPNSAGGIVGVTTGFVSYSPPAAETRLGHFVLTLVGSNTWVCSHVIGASGSTTTYGGGNKTLSGTLDRVRITTVSGTDTFDAGSINILYE